MHLERRPLELLILLVTRHERLVSRDDIVAQLWRGNVIIDFDTGVNTLVRKVRQALGDSPDEPVFIETVPGRGYRFVAPVTFPATASAEASERSEPVAPSGNRRKLAAAGLLAIVAVAVLVAWLFAIRGPSAVSIAVLPFENLTRDEKLDYLSAGLAEDTSASLAQIDLHNLRMVGRLSARAFVSSENDLSDVARGLGIDYVVASSLRAENANIRVTSRLIRVADNEQVWTASFDRELTTILGLQKELSMAIAEQVRLNLSPEVAAALARRHTDNPEAYDLYLRGRFGWSQLGPAGNRQALAYYEQAIARDRTYALAWAGIAQVLSTAPVTGDAEPARAYGPAGDAVQNAVRFGAGLTEAQYALGYFNYFLEWDWPAAEMAFRDAIALDPNSAIAHMMLGHVRSQRGDHVEARLMMRRARELDPFFSHTYALSSQMAFQARDYDSAIEFARQAIAINPEGWIGHLQLAQSLAELGRHEDAIAAYDTAERLSGSNSKSVAYRAYEFARNGRVDRALSAIDALHARSLDRYVPPYATAVIYAGLARPDDALVWLERAYVARDVHLVFLPVDPRWDQLRGDPRFQSLLERCGFAG